MEDTLDIFLLAPDSFDQVIDVPMFYYHVSEKKFRQDIFIEGLHQNDPELERATNGVYLWDNLESAQTWLNIHAKDNELEIWEVSSDHLDEDLIEYDEYGSGITCGAHVYRDDIQASFIRLFS